VTGSPSEPLVRLTPSAARPHHLVVKRSRRRFPAVHAFVCGVVVLGGAVSAPAAEIAAFVSGAGPGETWGTGYGGLLTITFFNIVGGEIEGAWQGGEQPDTGLFTLSGKAYLGPSFGRVVPYVGLGAGIYRESFAGGSDTGTLGSVFVGAKLKFPFGLVIRGEYQRISLPMATPLGLDHRYFFGLGLGV
jgi:Outer membrane protein beta-barrel domain